LPQTERSPDEARYKRHRYPYEYFEGERGDEQETHYRLAEANLEHRDAVPARELVCVSYDFSRLETSCEVESPATTTASTESLVPV
jgi:hypothetical protein